MKLAYLGLFGALALAGCTIPIPRDVTKGVTYALALGDGLPAYQLNNHITGEVLFDEEFIGSARRPIPTFFYVNGDISEKDPQWYMRGVQIATAIDKGNIRHARGSFLWRVSALVPDHLPRLKKGDIVEVRNARDWEQLKHWSEEKADVNVVLNILCRKEQADYEACYKALPRFNPKHPSYGYSRTPVYDTWHAYGLTFTRAYSNAGTVLPYGPMAGR
jgi:hypothetical protein